MNAVTKAAAKAAAHSPIAAAFIVPPVKAAATPVAEVCALLVQGSKAATETARIAADAAALVIKLKVCADVKEPSARAAAVCELYRASITAEWFQRIFNASIVLLVNNSKIEVAQLVTVDADGNETPVPGSAKPTPENADDRAKALKRITENNNKAVEGQPITRVVRLAPAEALGQLTSGDVVKQARIVRKATGTGRASRKVDTPTDATKQSDSLTDKQGAEWLAHQINSASGVINVIDAIIARAGKDQYTLETCQSRWHNADFDLVLNKARRAERIQREVQEAAKIPASLIHKTA